ncbi:SCO1664 family protein [Actinomadura mexicana]|uniref:SCO1664 family protein n=1 Tax=Actinomadura mexicana TaxID=134959 RepID=A0A238ZI17_9ACTN|nr:SCO1664 family protein [Actinomadura mexicana]SNR82809.1 conserved hypothetical protein [Actinomadura mexicana]
MTQSSRDRAPAGDAGGRGEAGRAVSPRDAAAAERLLSAGRLAVEGRLVQASNATLYCAIEHDGVSANCVYKPVAGERPLWDFPDGTLAEREVAAYEVSKAMGWYTVPPTVHRDGPYGPGMVQLWVEPDPDVDLVGLSRSDDEAVRRMSVFDAVVNNADRKIGHLLPPGDGHVYGCDHGVCFSVEYKLRTVLWQWRGKPLTPEAVEALGRVDAGLRGGALGARLAELLTAEEVDATRRRVELMLKHRIHPYPPEDWPAIPWPPL